MKSKYTNELPSLMALLDNKKKILRDLEYQRSVPRFDSRDFQYVKRREAELEKLDNFLILNYFEPVKKAEMAVLEYMTRYNAASRSSMMDALCPESLNDWPHDPVDRMNSIIHVHNAIISLSDKGILKRPRREAFTYPDQRIYELAPENRNIVRKMVASSRYAEPWTP